MAGFQVRRHGFKTAGAVTLAVIDDMLANGFTFCGTGAYVKPIGPSVEKFATTLEAGPTVDPLNPLPQGGAANQAWRINFTVHDNATLGIVAGPDTQLPNGGAIPLFLGSNQAGSSSSSTTSTKIMGANGVVGAPYSPLEPAKGSSVIANAFFADAAVVRPHYKNHNEGFINRCTRVWLDVELAKSASSNIPAEVTPVQPTQPALDLSPSFPFSYYLAITPRGMFLSIWEGVTSDTEGDFFSWLVIQRPVDRDTGATIVAGKAPVFCVSSVGNEINRFVVRESDILRASDPVSAVKDGLDTAAIINDKIQVAVSEDNQYVVSFPSRLNTSRYAYTYELDMIGYTAATVVSQNTEVPLTLYNEGTPRNYVAVHANMKNSNGMRIVALTKGGGITA